MPVPVFVALGAGAWGPVQDLRARPELRLVDSPRHAAVLVVAGRIPAEHGEALARVHDQVPHPRCSIAWSGEASAARDGVVMTGGVDELVAEVVRAFEAVRRDLSSSSPDRLPDEEPNEWRGVGPFGQGGEGMMGGTPYGRSMAMTGDDRDGLALDQLRLRLGPFLAWLPPGVVLEVTMQGEVLQEVTPRLAVPTSDDLGAPLTAADVDPVRAVLRWLALALHVHGLGALSQCAARLSCAGGDERAVHRLCRSVRRSGLLWSVRGVGEIEGFGDVADRWDARLDLLEGRSPAPDSGDAPHVDMVWRGLAAGLVGLSLTDAVSTMVSMHDRLVEPVELLGGPST
ncbi:MAG: hypothetical protein ACSLFO_13000 [Acidimicrobiales bacterium]